MPTRTKKSKVIFPLELKPVHDDGAKLLAARWGCSKAKAIRRAVLLVAYAVIRTAENPQQPESPKP